MPKTARIYTSTKATTDAFDIRVTASALVATLCVLAPVLGQSQPSTSGDPSFTALAKRNYYAVSFPRDPVSATFTGIHDYDDLLGRYDSATVDRRLVATTTISRRSPRSIPRRFLPKSASMRSCSRMH